MKVFIISDTHFPYHSEDAYKRMLALIKEHKPTHVIQIGDLLDQYVFSKYSRSLEITPKAEISEGLRLAKKMWADIKKLVPNAKCFQIIGNHDVRLAKRIAEKLPEMASFFNHQMLYEFPGVTVLGSDRDFLELDGVVYCHGWFSKSIDHARYFGKPTVHGHRHRPCIETEGKKLWSMDVGFMADEHSTPLGYTASKFSKWKLSCGMVDAGQPILFFLD